MQFHTRTKKPITINIVSLIDILTILLIFFVVTTTFKKAEPEVQIKLPESTQATEEKRSTDPVIIYATKDQKILIGDQTVPLDQLAINLRERKAVNSETIFALKADEGIPLGFFVKVLDASKEAGIGNLSLYTDPAPKPQP